MYVKLLMKPINSCEIINLWSYHANYSSVSKQIQKFQTHRWTVCKGFIEQIA